MKRFTLAITPLEDRLAPATLAGTAFHDSNFNGAVDTGETLLANVSVSLNLDGKGATILNTTTNANGQYTFTGVANGTHTLSASIAGYSKATANPVGVVVNTTGTVTVNLGFAPASVLAGFAFTDMDRDGSLDAGERLLPNYTVTLDLNSDGSIDRSTFTDANGVYRFSGVPNGNHRINIPNANITPAGRTVVVNNSDQSGLGFAIAPSGTLDGIAFLDSNATGVPDAGEIGLTSVTINFDFYNDGTVDKSVVTTADGKYSFTGIPDGTHLVTAQRSGYFGTTPSSFTSTYLLGSILLPPLPPPPPSPRTPGDPVGTLPQIPSSFAFAPSAIIGGYVYFDANKNGTPNAGEADLSGVTVRLDTDNNGSYDRTTTTDQFGRYAFSNVPNGTHRVNILPIAGYAGDAAVLTKTVTISGAANALGAGTGLTAITPVRITAVGTDSAIVNEVRLYDKTGTVMKSVVPFSSARDTRVATGDVNGDGIEDYAFATGPGTGTALVRSTQVRVVDGDTGADLFNIFPYGAEFNGGAFVALGDLNGDKRADLVITPDVTGGPRARIFSGNGFTQIADFFGIDDVNFRGGARAAIGDLNGDGTGDLVVTAGFGGGPRVALFDGKQLTNNGGPKFIGDFFAFEPDLRNGAYIAVGDTNGDGFADLVAGAGQGGAPRVTVFSGKDLINNTMTRLTDFFAAGQVADRSGARVAITDLDGDANADIVVGYRPVPTFVPKLAGYTGTSLTPGGIPASTFDIEPFPGFLGGISVG